MLASEKTLWWIRGLMSQKNSNSCWKIITSSVLASCWVRTGLYNSLLNPHKENEWNIKYCHITKVTKKCVDMSLIHWSSAPCPPSSLTAAASCGTNRVTISWLDGAGAHTYTANVVGNNGQTVSCTSNTTSCSVKVECGLTYTATVVSTVGLCNSTANNSIQFDSGNLKHLST